ncbi:MAG: hypothetical protein APF80_15505 [Alphaproteobacteria bacterium BRH_c36]|nr:MAG: hypothetical protein APF80_15505 [Alphaproteobacteria bacterium BRH_c36]
MKICFVVLAHHQPQVFQKLIRNISTREVDVVVHIDSAASIEPFRYSASNVHYMARRRRVRWASWSLTEVIIEGLAIALNFSDANYFIYLAGTDFPIRPNAELMDLLRDSHGQNFLNYYPLVPGIWGHALVARYRLNEIKSRFIDLRRPNDVSAPAWRRLGGTLVSKIETTLNARCMPRNTRFTNLYSGSSRWCLNRETIEYIVDFYRSSESRKLRRYLWSCANSDEIFVQTAVLNSPLKNQCIGFDEAAAQDIFAGRQPPMPDEKRVYLHYIDWDPAREDPAVMVERDLSMMRQSRKYFACKFLDSQSLPVINMIESELLSG